MIELERRERLALLTLQHGKANALDVEFCLGFVERLEEIERSDAEAVVITAAGRIFSAGVDLTRVLDGGPGYVGRFLPALAAFLRALFAFPKPVVAAIDGHAIAGGCVLACAADRRIMARGAGQVGVPELRVGVPFPPHALEIMRFVVPGPFLSEVLYLGAVYDAEGGRQRGLVDETVEPGELPARALEAAGELRSRGADTFRLTKRQIRAPYLRRMDEGQTREGAEVERIWSAPETLEAIRRYVEATFKKKARA